VKIGSLPLRDLRHLLRNEGIGLRMGPLVVNLRTGLPGLAAAIQVLYAHYEIEAEPVPHFQVRVEAPFGVRRYWRPQVLFFSDGYVPFFPYPRGMVVPFMEWSLNWCIHSHVLDHLILHSAVVERNGITILIAGTSGAGKSTLCAALVLRGWRLLSDELAVLCLDSSMVQPVPRPVGLKNQSIDIIRQFSADAVIGPVSSNTIDGSVAHMRPPAESVARWRDLAQPTHVLFPRFRAGSDFSLTEVPRARAFMRLAHESFNYSNLGVCAFDTLARLVDGCTCQELRYGALDDAIGVLSQLR
jgi:HprK-related kinase A